MRAHPRSRGENGVAVQDAVGQLGSSPLTRGKPQRGPIRTARRRLIPAHAGKTRPRARDDDEDQAHPRSRGENRAADVLDETQGGSSPLTRGKQTVWRARQHRVRLIPAHAGKTVVSTRIPGAT